MSEVSQEALFSYEEVRRNFIKSAILVALLMAMAFGLSWWIGSELGNVKIGIMIGLGVTFVVIPLQILTAKWAILGMSSGRRANPDDPAERQALQIVEGLAISAGLTRTPDLYIIPTDVPNAFASGLSEKSAFIGVTEGLLRMMDRQELEGVIGHEISHIIHRDIMLNQLVVGLISIILILAVILERVVLIKGLSGNRRSNDRNGGNAGAIILVLVLVAILIRPLAMLIASLLQMSISRKREFAADACSVRLCSYSEGLARALEKLGGRSDHYTKQEVDSLGGKQLACMYINFPMEGLFSTHPPIAERVRRLRSMY